jgi:hypothetical protein
MDNDSVAHQMNRGMFLAPDLEQDEEDDPLVEQAERNVEDAAEHAEEVEEEKRDRK